MKHIKRGYSWLFTRLAAIFGLTIGVQVATVHHADATYECSSYTTYDTGDSGANFKYCEGTTLGTFCTSSTNNSKIRKVRWYFFFTGCDAGYYFNTSTLAINQQVTPSATSSGTYSDGSCGIYDATDWGSTSAVAIAAANNLNICTSCPPFGTYNATSPGTGDVYTCYMSNAGTYTDDTGTFTWSSDCLFNN